MVNRRAGFRYAPFSDAPPVVLNYYMYLIAIAAFTIAAITNRIRLRTFALHAVVSFAILMAFNFFIHCILYGDCMRTALLLVTLLQVAQLVWFIRDVRE